MCCDGEQPAVCTTKARKARKQHRCEECNGIIPPGELYEYTRGLWDGSWLEFRTCLPCKAARAELEDNLSSQGDFCVPCIGQLYEDWPAELAKPAHVWKDRAA